MPFPFLAAATLLGAGASVYGQRQANRASRASAREQMAFQERQSSTAVQRQMQDMRSAGVNPILAAKYGGASSPSGASYDAKNELEGLPQAVGSAIQLKRMKAELENMHETNLNLRAQNLQIASQVEVNSATAKKIQAETDMLQFARLKEKATAPLYDAAGNIISAGVATARQLLTSGPKVAATLSRGTKFIRGGAPTPTAVPPKGYESAHATALDFYNRMYRRK